MPNTRKIGTATSVHENTARLKAKVVRLRQLMVSQPLPTLLASMSARQRRAYEEDLRRMRQIPMTETELMKLYHQMRREQGGK